ncbi:MAG: hypothetical protein HZC55_21085 [Verrucomicrobia bacterium]|nr:hypothetical protein [Verrucomicrobiota bacterium]
MHRFILVLFAASAAFGQAVIPWEDIGNKPTTLAGYGITATSANVAAAVSDETGSGALVFANSPTLASPTINSGTFNGTFGGNPTFSGNLTVSGAGTSSVGGNFQVGTPNGNDYLLKPGTDTATGSLSLQAGAGSALYGGSLKLYSGAHASRPGWVWVGLGSGSSGRKFVVSEVGLDSGSEKFSVDANGHTTAAGNLAVNGGARVSGAADTASSGALSLKVGRIAGSPANATDAFVGINDSGGPAGIAGDLVYIPRSTTGIGTGHKWFGHNSGAIAQRMSLSYLGDLDVSSANVGHSLTRNGLNGAGAASVVVIASDAKTANDEIGLSFNAQDSGSAAQNYGAIRAKITDTTSGSEDAAVVVYATTAGNTSTRAASFSGVGSAIKGTTSNDNAAPGDAGEFISSTLAFASRIAVTTGTAANITSVVLTAGDWDVDGVVSVGATGATMSYIAGGSSTVSAGLIEHQFTQLYTPSVSASVTSKAPIPITRYSLSATTTVYLVIECGFSAGTVEAYGRIRARRIR